MINSIFYIIDNLLKVIKVEDNVKSKNIKVNLKIKKFDRIRIESAGGGGYGRKKD